MHQPPTRDDGAVTTVGVISPPRYLDTTPERLRGFFPGRLRTIQTIVRIPGFTYDVAHYAAGWPAYEDGIADLAEAGADVVVQVGSPFAYFHPSGYRGLSERVAELEQGIGRPVVVAGLALVSALRHLNMTRVAVAGTYYPEDWLGALTGFLGEAGIAVTRTETFVSQGLCAAGEAERIGWSFDPELVMRSLRATAAVASTCDALVMGGVPAGIQDHLPAFEAEAGLPLVSAEGASLWRLSSLAGVLPPPGGHGRLLDGLAGTAAPEAPS